MYRWVSVEICALEQRHRMPWYSRHRPLGRGWVFRTPTIFGDETSYSVPTRSSKSDESNYRRAYIATKAGEPQASSRECTRPRYYFETKAASGAVRSRGGLFNRCGRRLRQGTSRPPDCNKPRARHVVYYYRTVNFCTADVEDRGNEWSFA